MSKRTKRTKPPLVDIEISEVQQLLERIKDAVTQEDHDLLTRLVGTLVELTRQLRQKGATIARLRRLMGIRSTEKTASVLGGDQGQGADDAASEDASEQDESAEQDTQASDDDASESKPPPEKKKKGHGRKPASAYDAEHIEVSHESLHAGCRCPDCQRGNLYELDEPAQWLRIFGSAPLIATCWDLAQLRCATCGKVFTAQPPDEAQGPKYSESAAAMMVLLRYGMGMPLNRLDLMQGYLRIPVPASTQWDVALQRVGAATPVYEVLEQQAANGTIVHNDDTYMPILEFMGKRRAKLLSLGELPDPHRTGLFTTAIVSVTSAGPIALFCTGRKHAGENLDKVLDEREPDQEPPIHMCDGLDRNLPKGHSVIECNCLVHGRRHIVDEVESFPDECRHVLEELSKVFKNEDTCKKEGLCGDERLLFHQQHSGPVMEKLKEWIEAQLEEKRVEPNSGLGDAFNYLLKRWDKLTVFLRVPDAPLDNNLCERVLKMAIRHRNNSKFYKTDRGAWVGDVYMTLIHTTMLHDENPFEYLTALMVHEKLVAQSPADWLPWTFRATLKRLELSVAEAA